jgi:short-subunit dehydrogenase
LPVALITGASKGIGAASARLFAQAGYDLVLVARNTGALAALAAELTPLGVRVETAGIDFGAADAIAPALAELLDRGLRPNVVINNAGVAATASLAEMPLAEWQWLVQLNLTSVFQVCQAVLPALRQGPGGLIINVSSHAARQAFPDWGAYCVSKAALASFSRCLAEEERPHGIRVTTLTLFPEASMTKRGPLGDREVTPLGKLKVAATPVPSKELHVPLPARSDTG